MRRILPIGGILLGLIAMLGSTAYSQPSLNFKRVTKNWPTIELYFTVECNGNPAHNMAKQDFRIFEQGVEVKGFTLWCPDPTVRCAMSAAIVIDASGSMGGAGNAAAKAFGRAFVDLMDGQIDEAAVLYYSNMATIEQHMTTLKPLLYSAVDALPANGNSAAWDGCYAGLIELINMGINQCRALLLIGDGHGEGSTRTPAEVVSLANRHRIRVFTIGVGQSIMSSEFEMVSLLTGGRYYQYPTASQIGEIYQDITTLSGDCIITYERDCADGFSRDVELQLVNFCGGTDVKTRSYTAPLDSTTFSDIYMSLGDVEGKGDTDIELPLNLITPVDPEAIFYPFEYTVHYDNHVQFKQAKAGPGSLLEGVSFSVVPVSGGVRITSNDRKIVKGTGELMSLVFHASDPLDTLETTIDINDPLFSQGCYIPIASAGQITIIPRQPIINCDLDMPETLSWQSTLNDYIPNPFSVTGRFFNTGDRAAEVLRYRISYESSDIALVSPLTDEQTASPSEIIPGNFTEVSWQVAAKSRLVGDSTEICITAIMDNHEDVVCCNKVYIPPAESGFECSVEVPEIQIRSDKKGYTPMPFTVRALLKNIGSVTSGTVHARIYPPQGYTLTGSVSERQEKKEFNPSTLSPGNESSVEWYLEHPVSASKVQSTIQVEFYEDDAYVCGACGEVTIPPLDIPFGFSLDATGPLTFCDGNSVILNAPSGYASYRWSTGFSGRSLTVHSSGSYFCIVKNADGQTGYSDTLQVAVHPRPKPQLVVNGNLPLCEGDTIQLDAGADFRSYLWSTGATTRSITVTRQGSYFVVVDNSAGCVGRSDTITVETRPSPPKPAIDRTGDMLTTEKAPNYQWLLNGSPIAGATDQFYVARQSGIYQVRVRNEYGCSSVSDELLVSVLAVDLGATPVVPTIHVFPDPVRDRFTISVAMPRGIRGTVWLVDVLGRAEKLLHLSGDQQRYKMSMDLTGYGKGLYHVVVQSASGIHVTKFMKH